MLFPFETPAPSSSGKLRPASRLCWSPGRQPWPCVPPQHREGRAGPAAFLSGTGGDVWRPARAGEGAWGPGGERWAGSWRCGRRAARPRGRVSPPPGGRDRGGAARVPAPRPSGGRAGEAGRGGPGTRGGAGPHTGRGGWLGPLRSRWRLEEGARRLERRGGGGSRGWSAVRRRLTSRAQQGKRYGAPALGRGPRPRPLAPDPRPPAPGLLAGRRGLRPGQPRRLGRSAAPAPARRSGGGLGARASPRLSESGGRRAPFARVGGGGGRARGSVI